MSNEVQKCPEFQKVNLALWKALFNRALGEPLRDCLCAFFEEASNLTTLTVNNDNKDQLFFPRLGNIFSFAICEHKLIMPFIHLVGPGRREAEDALDCMH